MLIPFATPRAANAGDVEVPKLHQNGQVNCHGTECCPTGRNPIFVGADSVEFHSLQSMGYSFDAPPQRMSYSEFSNQRVAFCARVQLVLSPLVCRGFDAVDLVQLLTEREFKGTYCALFRDVADPQLVQREVRKVAPAIRFELRSLFGQHTPFRASA